MKSIALGLILVSAISFGQAGQQAPEFKPKATTKVKATGAPVTRAEAAKTLDKVWKALGRGLKIQGAAPYKLVADKTPVSKDEVLASFLGIMNAAKPHFKRIPVSSKYNVKVFRADFDQAKHLGLVKLGFVMPYGPLVTGKTKTLTPFEFGDAVGVLIIRIADLAHLPSRRFSPSLMDAGG